MNLTGKQKRHLRSLGNALSPVVRLGKSGIDDGVIAALDIALTQHELVKVKLGPETPEGKNDAAELLSKSTNSAIAQVMGGTILLYRRHPKEPKIRFPKTSGEATHTSGSSVMAGGTIEVLDDDQDDDANNDE